MKHRHRLAKLAARYAPRVFPPFVIHIMGLEDGPDAEPDCVITTTFDGYMNVTSTTEVWREGAERAT